MQRGQRENIPDIRVRAAASLQKDMQQELLASKKLGGVEGQPGA